MILVTISVRLSKDIEKLLREEAKTEGKNISDIVNVALEKYHKQYQYFDSINAHHLDPVLLEAFFELVDTSEKLDKISTAGAAMIEKYTTYFSEGDNSFDTKLRLAVNFLNQNGIRIKQKQNGNNLSITAVHSHGEVFSNLLLGTVTKLFIKTSTVKVVNVKNGSFSISMVRK